MNLIIILLTTTLLIYSRKHQTAKWGLTVQDISQDAKAVITFADKGQ